MEKPQDHTLGSKPTCATVSKVQALFSVPWPPWHAVTSRAVHKYAGALSALHSLRPLSILDSLGTNTPAAVCCCSPALPLPPSPHFAEAPWQQKSLATAVPESWMCPGALTPTTKSYLAKALPSIPKGRPRGLERNQTRLSHKFQPLSLPWEVTMEYSMRVTRGFLIMPVQYIVLTETSQIHFVKIQ